jgi:hypothetical protein
MKPLEKFAEIYSGLEERIGLLMNQLCSETCGMCTACCCRADICEEVGESAFLCLLLKRQDMDAAEMDDRYGWLDLSGCALSIGRPPICYAYFCDQLLVRLPDDDARLAAQVLGRLLFYVGENALGGCHLTEIRTAAELEKIDVEPLFDRIDESLLAMEILEEWMETGRLEKAGRILLGRFPLDEL